MSLIAIGLGSKISECDRWICITGRCIASGKWHKTLTCEIWSSGEDERDQKDGAWGVQFVTISPNATFDGDLIIVPSFSIFLSRNLFVS